MKIRRRSVIGLATTEPVAEAAGDTTAVPAADPIRAGPAAADGIEKSDTVEPEPTSRRAAAVDAHPAPAWTPPPSPEPSHDSSGELRACIEAEAWAGAAGGGPWSTTSGDSLSDDLIAGAYDGIGVRAPDAPPHARSRPVRSPGASPRGGEDTAPRAGSREDEEVEPGEAADDAPDDPSEPVESAAANGMATAAAPTPNATANRPTRPT